MGERLASTIIESVAPQIDGGRYPVKRLAGERVAVSADIFKEGHDVLAAAVRYRRVSPDPTDWAESPMRHLGNDAWEGELLLGAPGRYVFTIEAWPDLFRTWAMELERKVAAGRDVSSELLEGAALLEAAAARARSGPDADRLRSAARVLRSTDRSLALETALDPHTADIASRYPDRTIASRLDRELPIWADRERAEVGAWYELFPRSASRDERRHGTFADVVRLLPEIAELGFDVLYLPPIHPIGRTHRKGKNNSLIAAPDDVGSPWAIGSAEGGHKSVHPYLGTLDDFRALVRDAAAAGIEIALDLAFQCSPDHPYVREHPEWFQRRPDGSIKFAENPPKRYEDIVNFDWLGPARQALWAELADVVRFWIAQGVKIFRVDNPHTKPLVFWEWLIRSIHEQHPDVVFLSEAFTRPKVMKALARLGFSQSYTYFTWRNFKHELEDYLKELTTAPVAEYMRGNLWPSTPDILPELLQRGGPPAFRIRLVLAATLSSSYGIYSGYELCENRALPGTEEYLDSEKYQLRAWDPERPGNIRAYVKAVNRLRRENAALRRYRNLRFHFCDNDRVLFYSKVSADGSNRLLCVLSLDPYAPQSTIVDVPLEHFGISPDETYQVHELLGGQRALWQGRHAQVHLTPDQPAAIYSVLRFQRRESGFEYYGG